MNTTTTMIDRDDLLEVIDDQIQCASEMGITLVLLIGTDDKTMPQFRWKSTDAGVSVGNGMADYSKLQATVDVDGESDPDQLVDSIMKQLVGVRRRG